MTNEASCIALGAVLTVILTSISGWAWVQVMGTEDAAFAMLVGSSLGALAIVAAAPSIRGVGNDA